MKTVTMNQKQIEFLQKNDHLTPIGEIERGGIIVMDQIKNEYNEYICYVLTKDCKVQSLHTFMNQKFTVL